MSDTEAGSGQPSPESQPASPLAPGPRSPDKQASDDRPLDPEKILRIAALAREVLEECRRVEPDEHTAQELADLHTRVTNQLYEALPQSLVDELEAIDLDRQFQEGVSGQEVKIAYSGLIGWLSGLFQGLQAAMQVQTLSQLAAQQKELGPPQDQVERDKPGRYL